MNRNRFAALFAILAVCCPYSALALALPPGTWLWDDGRAGVEFHSCGNATCGRIVWLAAEAQAGSPPVLDTKNHQAALTRRRVCGLDYITGLKSTESGKLKGGRIYDFTSGNSYDLDIDQIDPGKIVMRGYKGLRMFGVNLVLVRPSHVVQRCA